MGLVSRTRFTPPSPYRFDELGWLQFERLCSLVLEAEADLGELDWRGRSDVGRVALVEDRVVLAEPGAELRGPVAVAVFWVRDGRGPAGRALKLAERTAALVQDPNVPAKAALLLLTNLDGGRALRTIRTQGCAKGRRVVVLGAEEIAATLDRHPALRSALPSVLGARDLEPLVDSGARARSTYDVAGAQELARVFWPTRAYALARRTLGRHRFVVLTGPPEMGKTAIARMLALAQLTDGWEVHDCSDPDQVSRAFDRGRRQVFIADDAFGSTEYRPDSGERWALGLGRLLAVLDDRHWLIWTSRPAPLKAGLRRVQRERGSERFPAPGEVLVDASDLDLTEKTLILFRHAKARRVTGSARELLRSSAVTIVEHPHFTPERIRRFVTGRLQQMAEPSAGEDTRLLWEVQRELAFPTDAMRNSFRALAPEHRDLLIALLDAPAGLIDERELAATVRRHHAGGLSRQPCELIDRLTDHFLHVAPLGIGWVHPSWRDLVIEELRGDASARRRFLSACGVDGVTLALSHQGGARGERALPLLVRDADWDMLGDRLGELLRELEDQDLARVLFALAQTLADVGADAQRVEAESLARYLLETTRARWERSHRALPAFLLDAWYTLNDHVRTPVDLPRLLETWAELHPASSVLHHPDRAELTRTDEWLALAQTIRDHDPDGLRALGFYGRDLELLERLIVTLTHVASRDEELRELAEGLLVCIERLMPDLAARAHGALEIATLVDDLERRRWWTPEDIAGPPTTEPVVARRAEFAVSDVARVLADL
jgi:hypothetical protein